MIKNNIFVISTLGQLNQIKKILNRDNANHVLVISYGNKNLTNSIIVGLGDLDYTIITISNEMKNEDYKILFDNYKKFFEKFNYITDIYICSFEGHYNYINVINKKLKCNLHLVEEGSGTYNLLKDSSIKNNLIFLKVKKKGIKDWIRLINILIPKQKKSKILYKLLFFAPLYIRERFNIIKEYNSVNLTFPYKVKEVFHSEKYNEIFDNNIFTNQNEPLVIKEIESNAIIFVNQSFNIPNELHVSIVLEVLDSVFHEKKIYIKFHPKDSDVLKSEFRKQININKLEYSLLEFEHEIPFEDILLKSNINTLVGISSTALIYSKKYKTNIKCISIGEQYFSKIINVDDIALKDKYFIRYTIDVLRVFKELIDFK